MPGDLRQSLSKKGKNKEEPDYRGYQLIGDSQFLRFSETLLNLKRKETNGVFHLGFCVSGQRIADLLRRVQLHFASVSQKVILMIGTNDLLRGTSFEAMRDDFDELLKLLRKNAKEIILLTIPPVLKLENDEDHWNRLKKFNDHIKRYKNDKTIFVGDVYAEFIVSPKRKLSVCSLKSEASGSPESTPRNSRRRASSSERACHRGTPPSKPSNIDTSSPMKRDCRTSPQLPDEEVATTAKQNRRRPCDSKSNDGDSQPSPAKKRAMINFSAPFVRNSLKGMIRRPPTPSSGAPLLSRRARSLQEGNIDSCPSSTTSSGGHDPSATPSRAARTRNGKYSLPVTLATPTSSGNDALQTRSKRVRTPKKRRNSPTIPRSPSDNSAAVRSRGSLIPAKRCNSSSRAEDNRLGNCGEKSTEDDVENARKIRDDCFEEYFAGDSRRPDRVHLNSHGLCIIKGIIQGTINFIKTKHS